MKNKKFKKRYLLFLFPLLAGIFLLIALLSGDGTSLAEVLIGAEDGEELTGGNKFFLVGAIALPILLLLLSLLVVYRCYATKYEKPDPNAKKDYVIADMATAKGDFLASGTTKSDKKEDNVSRFFMLTQTDLKMANKPKPHFNDTLTLKELCERFRNFAASRLGLYYEESDIRQFIAGLSVSHILIMQGMSGTGKTSLAYAFGEFLQNKSTIVPIQPMWKERTDLIGYYNEFTKKFNETVLLQKMYEANYSDELYVTVLDEMNIARVEYYFAEFLSLLEIPNPEGRYLDVVTDKKPKDPKLLKNGQLKLPTNMWFIGTANNDDSTFAISDKVYDRAMIMNLDKKSTWFEAPETGGVKLSIKRWEQLVKRAKSEYKLTHRNKKRIRKLDEYMIENFHITFGNRIMKQINSYVPVLIACGGTELEAIDDILSKKVLRKLEAQNPIYVRNSAEGLKSYLDEVFGQDKMPRCKAYLTHLERNA